MIDRHKKYLDYWEKKLNISYYEVVWISFVKGLLISIIIYHFLIK